MTVAETVIARLVQQLTPDGQREVRDFAEFLLAKQARVSATYPWPADYFSRVVGSMPDFPDSDTSPGSTDITLDDADEDLRF